MAEVLEVDWVSALITNKPLVAVRVAKCPDILSVRQVSTDSNGVCRHVPRLA